MSSSSSPSSPLPPPTSPVPLPASPTSSLSVTPPSRSRAPIMKLPRETIGHIIFYGLAGDKRALAACSLASWMFVPSCRYVMFSNVRLGYSDEDVVGFLDLVFGSRMRRVGAESTVLPVLKCLEFTRKRKKSVMKRGSSGFAGVGRGMKNVVESVDFREMVEKLNDVRCIHLEGVPLDESGLGRSFWEFLGVLRGIEVVKVEGRALSGNMKLLEWACGLLELEELSVTRSRARIQPPSQDIPIPFMCGRTLHEDERLMQLRLGNVKRLDVRLLEIDGWDELSVVKWLLVQHPLPRVRSLRFGCRPKAWWDGGRERAGGQVVKALFETCGSGIEHLHLDIAQKELLDAMDLGHCDNLHTIHIDGVRVGPSDQSDQRKSLEMLLERITAINGDTAAGMQANSVALTVEVDPQSRQAFAFFGIPDVALFTAFDWGRVPEILEKEWLGERYSGDRWSAGHLPIHERSLEAVSRDRELVLNIQGGSKYGRERVEDLLRRGTFRVFDEKARFLVRFDAELLPRHGCCFQWGV